MAHPTSVNIYYPSRINPDGSLTSQTTSAFDLRKILYWNYGQPSVNTTETVLVSYDMNGTVRLIWPANEYDAAKQASLTAGG